MALGSALVDKARVHRRAKTNAKLQGTKALIDLPPSEWFRCRLTIPKGSETHEEGRHKRSKTPELTVNKRDIKGKLVDIQAGDKLEIQSREFGNVSYEVAGDPEPIRKRRSIIGWMLNLSKVES